MPIQQTGRLWLDATMIDLFFVTFVFLRFFQIHSQLLRWIVRQL